MGDDDGGVGRAGLGEAIILRSVEVLEEVGVAGRRDHGAPLKPCGGRKKNHHLERVGSLLLGGPGPSCRRILGSTEV